MTKINAQLLACLLGPALLSARPATMTTLNKNKVEHLWRPVRRKRSMDLWALPFGF